MKTRVNEKMLDERRRIQGCESALSTISAKVMAIGELIKFRGGDPPLNEEDVNFGIGEILTDLAEELEAIKRDLDAPKGAKQ